MKYTFVIIGLSIFLASCENLVMEEVSTDSPVENFEYLWKQVDEKYSYFEPKHIDWDSVYNVYRSRITDDMTNEEFFNEMFEMLCALKDGHVNLKSPFNVSRYDILNNAPVNFNWQLIKDSYISPGTNNRFPLAEDYYITGPFYHQVIGAEKPIGYVYYPEFSTVVQDYDIQYLLSRMTGTAGLIIDVRNNGGGAPINIFTIINRLTNVETHIYSSWMKEGPGHNDFGEELEIFNDPASDGVYQKPIVLLTNRNCYSATSFFAAALKSYPNVTQIGDTTGGGAGAPHGGQLPNGWYYRFSVTKSAFPSNGVMVDFETGVPPDINIDMDPTDEATGIDNILEKGIDVILQQSK